MKTEYRGHQIQSEYLPDYDITEVFIDGCNFTGAWHNTDVEDPIVFAKAWVDLFDAQEAGKSELPAYYSQASTAILKQLALGPTEYARLEELCFSQEQSSAIIAELLKQNKINIDASRMVRLGKWSH